ncbi:hypothetical protein GCM10007879_02180 [Maritalea porphyrae]|uniref:Uncharacterized protein n=1 Tax=Maritalea porphyrae TaxID=880732 RepID=A0ABQ5UMA6_9HYPH|nr:hypothetical protein GCM10007879_02180 [Maritalea porphyrae]
MLGNPLANMPHPREARKKLRTAARDKKNCPALAAHKPRTPWQWVNGSDGDKEMRKLLTK